MDVNVQGASGGPGSFWKLNPEIVYLNHGSFGSCPRQVLEYQCGIRERMEREPMQFFVRDLEALLDEAGETLAGFLGARVEDLVFVPNATSGVNTVLRSLKLKPGDELLVTDHEYNACRNALDFVAARSGARVVAVPIPFPLRSAGDVIAAVTEAVTQKTRLALIDHITSPTGVVLPIEDLVSELRSRGVETLVDGAHAPGMVALDLDRLGAGYYTANCHKWICAPKGSAFLHVRRDLQAAIRPLTISHGANSVRTDRSRFQLEFGWAGTWDPSAYLSVPEAIRVVGSLLPGGWTELRKRNRALVLAGRDLLCRTLEIPSPCPDAMIGSLASVPLWDAPEDESVVSPLYGSPLQEKLLHRWGIEVPIAPWPVLPKRVLRISAQLYNTQDDYAALSKALGRERVTVS